MLSKNTSFVILFCAGEDSIDVIVDRFDPGREVASNNGMTII